MSGADRSAIGRRLVERAYLEGDFLLRSGRRSRYYLDKYRFETDPELLDGLGRLLAAEVQAQVPDAQLLAGPELGAVPLAAVTAIHTGLPYVIVRKAAKQYGTSNRIEGVHERGVRACLIEDVVTSGGALLEAAGALRDAGIDVSAAICVVDRQEGGAEAIVSAGLRFTALFTAADLGVGAAPSTT